MVVTRHEIFRGSLPDARSHGLSLRVAASERASSHQIEMAEVEEKRGQNTNERRGARFFEYQVFGLKRGN